MVYAHSGIEQHGPITEVSNEYVLLNHLSAGVRSCGAKLAPRCPTFVMLEKSLTGLPSGD